ncbi:MAG: proline--tRNA ligase [Desulfovibrionaceae bacterium]
MRRSSFFIPTLKESIKDAEVISHKLLLRAGMIRQVASGIYAILPFGYLVLRKIQALVESELENAGVMQVFYPILQPSELWERSGRWLYYGKELFRLEDRNQRSFALGPTHEEIAIAVALKDISSYKQLPCNFYQIHWKFRDEMRPRFGLLRGREFLMKDAYSFDRNEDALDISYKMMYDVYVRIFERLGLSFKVVEADTGSIGGSSSHEFILLSDVGEDTIVFCSSCSYAANIERAECIDSCECIEDPSLEIPLLTEIFTPNVKTIEELSLSLDISKKNIIKSLLYVVDNEFVLFLLRGDRELNQCKVETYLSAQSIRKASEEEILELSSMGGAVGPIALKVTRIIVDYELKQDNIYIVGANKKDYHIKNFSFKRDLLVEVDYADIRTIAIDDMCPRCEASLNFKKGIEVGHIFKLGTKYSEAMNATFVDEDGLSKHYVMGCYGIGVSRMIAAIIEQNNDEFGIVFPPVVSPFDIIIVSLDSDKTNEKAEELYTILKTQGYNVLFDDTTERAGFKLKDADLLGIPLQIILGRRSLEKGCVECKNRKTGEKHELALENFKENFLDYYKNVFPMNL